MKLQIAAFLCLCACEAFAASAILDLRDGKLAPATAEKLDANASGFHFNGSSSLLKWRAPEKLDSISFFVQAKLDRLPEKEAAFIVRPLGARSSVLGCDSEGRAFLSVHGEGTESITIKSQVKLEPGKFYNILSVANRHNNGNSFSVYINGHFEGQASLMTPALPYGPELCAGALPTDSNSLSKPFAGCISRILVYDDALNAKEIESLNAELAVQPAVAADGSVSVQDFGAFPGDGLDDTAAVRKAVDFAVAKGAKRLAFPKGVYDFFEGKGDVYTPARWVVWRDGIKNLEIDGCGSYFIMHGLQFFCRANDCENLSFKNFSVDYKPSCFSAGKVVDVAPDSRSFDIELFNDFVPNGGESVPAFTEIEPDSWLRVNKAPMGLFVCGRTSKTELLGPRLYRLYISDSIPLLKTGMAMLLRHHTYTGCVFRIHSSKNLSFENLTIHAGSGMGIVAQYVENVRFKGVKFVPPPYATWKTTVVSDLTNLLCCSGEISYENCVFSGSHDDSINIFTNFWGFKALSGANSAIVKSPKFGSRESPMEKPGDIMDFMRPDFRVYASMTIKSIKALKPGPLGEPLSEIEFVEPLPKDVDLPNDLLMKRSGITKIVVRDCLAKDTTGSFVFQAPNVLVENCRFERITSKGVYIQTSMSPWFEGGPSQNVVVRGNVFKDCERDGTTSVPAVFAVTAVGRNVSGPSSLMTQGGVMNVPVHRDIEFSGNVIDGCNNSAIIVSSAENVVVKNNVFKNVSTAKEDVRPWRMPERDWRLYAVNILTGVKNLTFEGNRCSYSDDPKRLGRIAVGLDVDMKELHFKNNEGFSIERRELFPERAGKSSSPDRK